MEGVIVSFVVKFNKQTIEVEWETNKTILSLKEHLSEITNIPPSNQKLMFKGLLKDTQTLQEAKVVSGAKLLLIGSSKSSVENVVNQKIQPGKLELYVPPATTAAKKSRFHYIAVLPLPNADKAREILEQIRSDDSVIYIMEKYNWNILYLRELSLEHTKLLGWNCNQGLEIMLRLRRDKENPNEFRTYDEIKDVLIHELTHMVWGDHDGNFYNFMRQLQSEIAQFEKNKSKPAVMLETEKKSGFTLGGGSGRDGMHRQFRPNEMALQAAERRLTAKEMEVTEGCGGTIFRPEEAELILAALEERKGKEEREKVKRKEEGSTEWACEACTFVNSGARETCEMCLTEKKK
eukprot:TRINITY_DN20323_c0_g1_i1.p1 TRINITY_DN20323_c0_g1~~TRINITY_DN20323_c0_g1_i1.p1  ORF type:complete len:349 (-),score=79.87 TRINITY_DN20323_c0_g1_i1:26-1072(-)